MAIAVARVKAALEQIESTPAIQPRTAPFISDPELRKILERDYTEIQKAWVTGCWKSVIILSGGSIEAILTDLLLKNSGKACASPKAPKQADITRWDLEELIAVAVDLHLVSGGAEKLSHSVRAYRNLVHPGNEIRNQLTFDAEEGKIAFEVLNLVWRDVSKRSSFRGGLSR